jgi:O-antigen ligase
MQNIKALIVVLVLAVPAFYLGRQLTASAVAPREFAVWRNAWFVATVAAFLSGSFFVFAAIEVMICLYAYAFRAATLALFFLLLFAAPLVSVSIGGLGAFNLLFEINNARLLVIILLFPVLFATNGTGRRNGGGGYTTPDWLVVGYVLLMIALQFEQSNATQILRAATLLTLDVLVPYFAFSRAVTSLTDLRKVLLALVVAVLPFSLIAVFETAKGWHLYHSIALEWGGSLTMGYKERDGILRASASADGPIVLGFNIMVAIGCVLAVWQTILSRTLGGIALGCLAVGLVASLSRGPWVGTAVLIVAYLATGPKAVANLVRFAVIGAVVLMPLLLTPVGNRLLNFLPFIGSVDAGSLDYRQHLFENAIRVIERNPWLGSVDYMSTPEMREMVQGEGIIDIVNTYLQVALSSGLVGLGLFLGVFVTILIGLWRLGKFDRREYARALMATLIAVLVTMSTVSSIDSIPYICWSSAGLCVALIRIAYRERAAVARAAHASRAPA